MKKKDLKVRLGLTKKTIDSYGDWLNFQDIQEWVKRMQAKYYRFQLVFERVQKRAKAEGLEAEEKAFRERMIDQPINLEDFVSQVTRKKCLYCKKEFIPARGGMVYCSSLCASRYNANKRRKKALTASKIFKSKIAR